jgi:hypothetical protein
MFATFWYIFLNFFLFVHPFRFKKGERPSLPTTSNRSRS